MNYLLYFAFATILLYVGWMMGRASMRVECDARVNAEAIYWQEKLRARVLQAKRDGFNKAKQIGLIRTLFTHIPQPTTNLNN